MPWLSRDPLTVSRSESREENGEFLTFVLAATLTTRSSGREPDAVLGGGLPKVLPASRVDDWLDDWVDDWRED